jgi:hypothetical protein
MFVQALGSGTVGVAVDGGLAYAVVFRGLAAAVGAVAVVLVALYAAGRLPAGGRQHRTPA